MNIQIHGVHISDHECLYAPWNRMNIRIHGERVYLLFEKWCRQKPCGEDLDVNPNLRCMKKRYEIFEN